MISNKIADAVIERARAEKRECDKSAHAFRDSYNQPLGYHVATVFDAVTALEHTLPYCAELEKCSDAARCREIILSTAE